MRRNIAMLSSFVMVLAVEASPRGHEDILGGTAMHKRIAALVGTLILVAAGSISVSSVAAAGEFQLESTIAFTSTRDNLALNPIFGAEIYLSKPVKTDGTWALTNLRRLTNDAFGDAFANLSPDGKKIAFDTNRLTSGAVCGVLTYNNISDLFLMNTDGTGQTLLTRGSSATWSPDSKTIAFHASASYYASGGVESGCPIRRGPGSPGSATSDSDIFVVNADEVANAESVLAKTQLATNITNSPDMIEDDPDWSPDGQRIVFTSHSVTDAPDPSDQAEIFVMNPDGTGLQQLTSNAEEERGPAWSPDGTRIVFICRIGAETDPAADFEICVMNADGSGVVQLTGNTVFDGTPTFSPDGQQILFHRTVGAAGSGNQQLFIMNADGTPFPDGTFQKQLTFGTRTTPDGLNNLANWGELRVKADA
jgi:TolB protein